MVDARTTKGRLTKLQSLLLAYISDLGGEHVYISRTLAPARTGHAELGGYTWEGVRLSLRALVRKGLISADRDAFFTLISTEKGVQSGLKSTVKSKSNRKEARSEGLEN